jgi:hypothetical protein
MRSGVFTKVKKMPDEVLGMPDFPVQRRLRLDGLDCLVLALHCT